MSYEYGCNICRTPPAVRCYAPPCACFDNGKLWWSPAKLPQNKLHRLTNKSPLLPPAMCITCSFCVTVYEPAWQCQSKLDAPQHLEHVCLQSVAHSVSPTCLHAPLLGHERNEAHLLAVPMISLFALHPQHILGSDQVSTCSQL